MTHHTDDLFTRVYTWLRDDTFLGDVSWRSWMDVGGIVLGGLAGYTRNPRLGLAALGIAITPETLDFMMNVEHGMSFRDAGATLGMEAVVDALFIGGSYFFFHRLRAYRDRHHEREF